MFKVLGILDRACHVISYISFHGSVRKPLLFKASGSGADLWNIIALCREFRELVPYRTWGSFIKYIIPVPLML